MRDVVLCKSVSYKPLPMRSKEEIWQNMPMKPKNLKEIYFGKNIRKDKKSCILLSEINDM